MASLASEVFSLAIIWFLVSGGGPSGVAYLLPQLLAAAISGSLGQRRLAARRPVVVVVAADGARFIAAVVAVVAAMSQAPVWVFVVAGVIAAAVRPHHDAGIMAALRRLNLPTEERQRQAARFDNILRLARIAGPAVAASAAWLLSETWALIVPVPAFLLAVVLALWALWSHVDSGRGEDGDTDDQARALPRTPVLWFCFCTQGLNAGAWYVGFVVCVALLLDGTSGALGGLAGFGVATVLYGMGNLGAGIVMASRSPTTRILEVVLAARLVAASGYVIVAAAYDTPWLLLLGAVVVAAGTPIADITFVRHVQDALPWQSVATAFRRKIVSEYLGMLVAVGVGALALAYLPPEAVVLMCAGAMVVFPVLGYVLVRGAKP